MKINKKALIGMCGGILLADILFVGWALNSLRANETNTVYETKSPAVPVVSAKEKKPEKRKKPSVRKKSWESLTVSALNVEIDRPRNITAGE